LPRLAPRLEELLAARNSEAGVYILIGSDPLRTHRALYIGEAEIFRERLGNTRQGFWVSAIVFVSKRELTRL